MPNPDTEEWKIDAYMDYVPKVKWKQVACDECYGSGMMGGGFKSLDDPTQCHKCGGRGWREVATHPAEPKPKLPQDLLDHMRKAYLEYKLK